MRPLELLVGLVLVAVLLVLSISLRRRWLSREGGAVEMSLRLKPRSQGRGWVLGLGRFVGDELQWFRVFSLSPRPRRTLSRRSLEVHKRRQPTRPESLALIKGMEVLELRTSGTAVEIGLDPSALMGFLAWLEAQPPGAAMPG
ncbi:MAG: DUF2550 domain-containing protein [Actinomycetota bacterium]|nr:DUF2550 domain-containing protein [Actinomycetota bacterium]